MKLDPKIPSGPLAEKWDKHRFDSKLVNPANKRKFDIIVVGSGLAGASASASLAEFSARRIPGWFLSAYPATLRWEPLRRL